MDVVDRLALTAVVAKPKLATLVLNVWGLAVKANVAAARAACERRGLDLIAAWGKLNPIYRPHLSSADQIRDLVNNGLYERILRREDVVGDDAPATGQRLQAVHAERLRDVEDTEERERGDERQRRVRHEHERERLADGLVDDDRVGIVPEHVLRLARGPYREPCRGHLHADGPDGMTPMHSLPPYAEMLGVDDYIRKPFAMDRLLEAVEKALGEPETEEAPEEGQ